MKATAGALPMVCRIHTANARARATHTATQTAGRLLPKRRSSPSAARTTAWNVTQVVSTDAPCHLFEGSGQAQAQPCAVQPTSSWATAKRVALELRHLLVGADEVGGLRQRRVLELGRIPDEHIQRRHALDRRIEPREALIGDRGR